MSKTTEQGSARHGASVAFRRLARGLALMWVVPALLFNVDWTGHGSWQANSAAVLMILGSALFIEGALRFRSIVLTPVCVLAAFFLVYANTKAAIRNLSLASEAASEAKTAEIARGSHLASQRSQLQKRLDEQVQQAGWAAVGTVEAELAQLKVREARRWKATDGCDPARTTSSAEFCAQVAGLVAKVEAAKARDKINAELKALPAPEMVETAKGSAPVADPYVANVMALLVEAGWKPTERLVRAEEAMTRALAFELLAALGPTCWLAFIEILLGASAAVRTARSRKPTAKPEKVVAEPDSPARATADDIDRWMVDDLEDGSGSMRSGDLRKLALAWFDARGLAKPDEQELWARIRARYKHDPNNGRPRYLGVKQRQKPIQTAPHLVVSNA